MENVTQAKNSAPAPKRKVFEIMKEMSEQLLRNPAGVPSSEAAHVALMFANIAWNKTVGLGQATESYGSAWEQIEAENPEMWSEFKSNDVDGMIDKLILFKKRLYPDDQRRILTCGIPDGKIRGGMATSGCSGDRFEIGDAAVRTGANWRTGEGPSSSCRKLVPSLAMRRQGKWRRPPPSWA
jgi:hypothetical protein